MVAKNLSRAQKQALGFVPLELCVGGAVLRHSQGEFSQVNTQSKHVLAAACLLTAKMDLRLHSVYLRRDMRFNVQGPALIR